MCPPAQSAAVSLEAVITDFLADLAYANRSVHTRRVYAADLQQFAAFYRGPLQGISADVLRAFFLTCHHLSSATRARKQAALASFLAWAYRHHRAPANPMLTIERLKLAPPEPRGLPRSQIEAILAGIPARRRRDRLLFRLIFETGLRIGEALAVYVEDVDLTPDDEHLRVRGKGGRVRTVLLDDLHVVRQLRTYLKDNG